MILIEAFVLDRTILNLIFYILFTVFCVLGLGVSLVGWFYMLTCMPVFDQQQTAQSIEMAS